MSELEGSENQALLQALRNLWPLLSTQGRENALETVNQITAAL